MRWLEGILAAAVSRQLVDEFRAWTPRLAVWLIGRAAALLPIGQRERFTEEWLSHDAELPGEVARLGHAIGCFCAVPRMKQVLSPNAVLKRLLDIVGGLVLLVWLAPMFAMVPIFIRVRSGGSVWMKNEHTNADGSKVVFWTFHIAEPQSMAGGTQWIRPWAGNTLYRTGLYVLPMLLNIVAGDISLTSFLRLMVGRFTGQI